MTRFVLSDIAFARGKAKKLRSELQRAGHVVSLGRAQKALAVVYGYRDWAELVAITAAARFPATPPGAAARIAAFVPEVLVGMFGLDRDDAVAVLSAVGATDPVNKRSSAREAVVDQQVRRRALFLERFGTGSTNDPIPFGCPSDPLIHILEYAESCRILQISIAPSNDHERWQITFEGRGIAIVGTMDKPTYRLIAASVSGTSSQGRQVERTVSSILDGSVVEHRAYVEPDDRMYLRRLDHPWGPSTLDELGMSRLDVWKRIVAASSGLIIVGGSAGCGISTTFGATSRYLASIGRTQNIIFIGEIRDEESMSNAVRAASQGELVFGSVNAGNAARMVARAARNAGAGNAIPSLLRGVLYQYLVGGRCRTCSGTGEACPACLGTKIDRRIMVCECVEIDGPGRAFEMMEVSEGRADPSWQTIDDDVQEKVLLGEMAPERWIPLYGAHLS